MKTIRTSKKVAAVERLIRGEPAAAIAGSLGTTVDRVEAWHKSFYNAGKGALRYTREPNEWPTLEDVDAAAQRAFPLRMMHEFQSAACFFVAQFFGKNDVIHVYKSGIPKVTLVDIDEAKLEHMRKIYPQDWEVISGDALQVAIDFIKEGRKYDLVVCDPYSNMVQKILENGLEPFRSIAKKCLMHYMTVVEIERLAGGTDFARLADAYRQIDPSATLVDLIVRSTHSGGVYWAVVRFDGAGARTSRRDA